MADSIRKMLAATLLAGMSAEAYEWAQQQADALLASPLADIIDLAAKISADLRFRAPEPMVSPEVRALLADWRASRAKRVEPEAPSRMMGTSVNEAPFERPTP